MAIKIRKILIILLITSLLPIFLNSQSEGNVSTKYSITWSDSYKEIKDAKYLMSYDDGNDFYNIYKGEEGLIIQEFDSESKLKNPVNVSIPEMPEKYKVMDFLKLGEKSIALISYSNRDTKEETVCIVEIDMKKAKVIGKPKILASTDNLYVLSYLSKVRLKQSSFQSFKFDWAVSSDKSKLSLFYHTKGASKKNPDGIEKIGVVIVDAALNVIKKNEYDPPYTSAIAGFKSMNIDNNGNIYFVFYQWDTKDQIQLGKKVMNNYRFILLGLQFSENKFTELFLDNENSLLKEPKIFITEKGKPILTGLYTNKLSYYKGSHKAWLGDWVNGYYVRELDFTKHESSNTKFFEFSDNDLMKFHKGYSEIQNVDKGSNERESRGLEIVKIHELSNGSLTMVCEQNYKNTTYITQANGTKSTKIDYYFLDIYVINFDINFKTNWITKIPKYQYGPNYFKEDISLISFSQADRVFLFYVDNPDNNNLSFNETPAKHVSGKDGMVQLVKINAEGKATKQNIYDIGESSNWNVFPILFKSNNKGTVYFHAANPRKNIESVGVINFK